MYLDRKRELRREDRSGLQHTAVLDQEVQGAACEHCAAACSGDRAGCGGRARSALSIVVLFVARITNVEYFYLCMSMYMYVCSHSVDMYGRTLAVHTAD